MNDTDNDLQQLYLQANAYDKRRPGERVRQAVMAHAQMALDGATGSPVKVVVSKPAVAANFHSWKAALVASVLLTPLVGILVSQHLEQQPELQTVPASAPASDKSPALPAKTPEPAVPAMASNSGNAGAARAPNPANDVVLNRTERLTSVAEKAAAAGPSASDDALTSKPAGPAKESQPNADLGSSSNESTTALAMPPSVHESKPSAPAAPMNLDRQRQAVQNDGKLAFNASNALKGRSVEAYISFFQAVREDRISEIDALLASGTPVNARDADGKTALIWAAQMGHERVVRRLLALGANRSLVDSSGLTALQHAKKNDYPGIITLLETID